MIKAVLTNKDGEPAILLLGLSDENWRRMRELGQPIAFELGPLCRHVDDVKSLTLTIVAGADEAEIEAALINEIDPSALTMERVSNHVRGDDDG